MALISRLTSSGDLLTNVPLDEVSQVTNSQSPTGIFSSMFDEVTLNPISNGLSKRETVDGKLLISGMFDEYTGVS